MIVSTRICVDLQTPGYPPLVHAAQNEQYSRSLKIDLYDGGVAWPVPDGACVAMRYCKPDGTSGYYDTLPDGSQAWSAEGNTVSVHIAPQMLTVPGVVYGQLEITQNHSLLVAFQLRVKVIASVADSIIQSDDYVNWLQWMEEQLHQRLLEAKNSGEFKGGPGDKGDPAVLIDSSTTYQASASGTVIPEGVWLDTIPAVEQAQYLWTRTILHFNSGSAVTSYSVSRMGLDGSCPVPECSADDNGKFLRVVGGVATWQTVQNAEEVSF